MRRSTRRPSVLRRWATLRGHSLRITGARFLAAMNISVMMIQLLGRWDSAVVLRYITDAPLLALTRAYIEAKKGETLGSTKMRAIEELTKNKDAEPKAIADKVIAPLVEIDNLREDLDILRTLVSDDIDAIKLQIEAAKRHDVRVRAVGKNKWHRAKRFFPSPPQSWKTFCGWKFAGSSYTFAEAGVPGKVCRRCSKAMAKAVQDSSDGEDRGHLTESTGPDE